MAGTNIGTAYITIMPSTKGISGSISNALSGESVKAGKTAGMNIVGAIKGVIATAAIGKFFKDALDAGGELEQNLGGTEAVFGEFAKNVQKTADDAYKNMGLSASDYMATANKMGSLFQGSGVEQARALELTTTAMQRAADVASVMGLDTTAAMESIAGAAKGNFTMMDNLGVAMNATTISAYALEKGMNFKWDTASNAEKAEVAMKMFMERTEQYAGNFARESEETFAGSLGAMKAAKENFISNLALGRDVQGPLEDMANAAKNFIVGNVFPMIGNILKELPTLIGNALTDLFNNLPGMVDNAIAFTESLASAITDGSGQFATGLVSLFQAGMTALTEADWMGLGKSILTLLWTGIKTVAPILWDGLKSLASSAAEKFRSIDWAEVGRKVVSFIGNAIGSVGRWIFDAFKSIGDTAKERFQDVDWSEAGKNAFHALVNGVKEVALTLWDGIKTIGTTAAEYFKDIDWAQVGKDIIEFIANGITAVASFVWEALTSLATTASEFFTGIDWEDAGKNVVQFIINGVVSLAQNFWNMLKSIGQLAGSSLKEIDWLQLGKDILTAIRDGVVAIGEFLWGALKEIGSTAIDWLLEIDWIQSGIDIVNGIIDGIVQFGSNIADTLVGFAKSAWTKLKDFFAIGSPSKLMRDTVGKWIPLGIAEGIEDEAGAVTEAMQDIAKDASVEISPIANLRPLASIRSGISSFVNNITVNGAENPEDWAARFARELNVQMRMA